MGKGNGKKWWKGRPAARRKERIMLAVPTMSNALTIHLHGFLSSLTGANLRTDVRYHFEAKVVNGFSPVEYARNFLVGAFLKSECERLWFIDSDMLPDENTANLLETDADIACARMFRFDHENPAVGTSTGISICAMNDAEEGNGKFRPIVPSIGQAAVQDVDAVGTGCTIFRRKVFEDARLLLPGSYEGLVGEALDLDAERDDPQWAPPFFRTRYKPNGQRLAGEDVDLTSRAKRLGYSVKVNLNAHCGHYKSVDLDQVVTATHGALQRHDSANPLLRFYRREVERCA